MSFTFQCYILAELKIQRVSLRRGAGNYFLEITIEASSVPHNAAVFYITDLRAAVRACNLDLGTAVPAGRSFLDVAHPGTKDRAPTWLQLAVPISQDALQLIEDVRAGADVQLDVRLQGTVNAFMQAAEKPQQTQSVESPLRRISPLCRFEPNFYAPTHVEENLQYTVPQSEWIKLLNVAGYGRSILFEVAFPRQQAPAAASKSISHFEAASAAFARAEYATTVAKCREALEAAASECGIKWVDWKKVSDGDNHRQMSIADRLALCWSASRHATHPAHHGDDYEREEARYILGMTALAISMALRKPGLFVAGEAQEPPTQENLPGGG